MHPLEQTILVENVLFGKIQLQHFLSCIYNVQNRTGILIIKQFNFTIRFGEKIFLNSRQIQIW